MPRNIYVEQIKHYLAAIAKLRGNSSGQEQLILDHGIAYNITPNTLAGRRGPEKQCYMNAFNLAYSTPGVTYVEGLVHIGIIPIEHAWVVNAAGDVIDPTLRKAGRVEGMEPVAYFGIPFRTEYIKRVARETGVYGIISHTNLPLLEGSISPTEFLQK